MVGVLNSRDACLFLAVIVIVGTNKYFALKYQQIIRCRIRMG